MKFTQKVASPMFLVRFTCYQLIFLNLPLSSSTLSQGKRLPHMTSDVEDVSGKSFDYIVVGGGATGCPLAATLSEKFSVLLIERGGSPYGNLWIIEKRYNGLLFIQTDEFSSVAQSFIAEDGVQNLRGRVLGGSTAINRGFYSRASEDFVERSMWDEQLVNEAYEWVESKIVFEPDELTTWQTAIQFGLLEAGILPYNGFSLEHIEGTKVGATIFDEHGKRHTSADLLAAGDPKNLMILLNATVKNVILDENEKRARGIRFINSDGNLNDIHEVYLNQPKKSSRWGDVILSAGAIGSHQILLLSGIGPYQHLKDFNIPLTVDLKEVGQRMQDNPSVRIVMVDTMPQKRIPDIPQVAGIADDFRFIIEGGIVLTSFNASTTSISAKIAFPSSKGKLQLNNTDPRRNPSVKFNYLAKENDMEECVTMFQLLQKVANSEAVSLFPGIKHQGNLTCNPNELRRLCKNNVRTFYHYHGGCVVGSVVDNDYRVYGVKGLRVIDGSTFQESPGTNPMATCMMLGRYQGIKMLNEL